MVLMQVARVGDATRLTAAHSRQRDVGDTVLGIISHVMNMASEHGGHIARLLEQRMDSPLPVISVIATEPARMVQEDKLVLALFAAFQRLLQELKLRLAHRLSGWPGEGFLAGLGVAFVSKQHNEVAILVF